MAKSINIMKYDDILGTVSRQILNNSFRLDVTDTEEAMASSVIMQETEELSQEQLRHVVYNLFAAESEAILKLAMESKRSRLPPEMMCLICLGRPRDVVFLKCGHLIVCEYCQTDYKSCPMCHQPIKAFVVVNWDYLNM